MEGARPRRDSAGHADPGKEGLEGQTSKIQHAPGPPCGMGGRIQCAAHRPPREGVVTHSVVVRQMKQARQVNSHIVEISCQDRPRMGLLGASQACKNWQELPEGHVHRTLREQFLTTFANYLYRNQAFMDFGRFFDNL